MEVEEISLSEHSQVVAIVDDDQRVLYALQELLESAGYETLSYQNASSLLASNDLSRIHCVISDIGMPEVNGFELQETLARDHPEISVILITGRYELVECLPSDSSLTILKKPFESTLLLSKILDSRTCPST